MDPRCEQKPAALNMKCAACVSSDDTNQRLCFVNKDHSAGVVIKKQGPVKGEQNNEDCRNKHTDQVNATKYKLSSFYFSLNFGERSNTGVPKLFSF